METYTGNAMRKVVHPSYQAWSYAQLISDYNSTVQDEKIQLSPCAFLHNYLRRDNDPIDDDQYHLYTDAAPAFTMGQMLELRDFIKRTVKRGDRSEVLYRIDHGKIRPSKSLQDAIVSMVKGNEEFTMIDEQRVVYEEIIRISELDEGELLPDSGEVDLVQTARNVIDILRPAADKRHIELEIEADIEEPARAVEPAGAVSAESAQHAGSAAAVTGTARLIEEMVYNLCDNAVKYNREGGRVLVRIWKEGSGKADGASGTDPDPSFGGAGSSGEDKTGTGTDQSGAVCISVEDTGIGIPEEEQERVFERFYRVDKSHSRKMGGTGLGLSIVKHTAQLHGASVDLESHPGEGTKITVRFPKKEDAAAIGDGGQDEQDRVL